MADEIAYRHSATGATLYAAIRNAAGQYWDATAEAMETLVPAEWTRYAIAMTETDSGTYLYLADVPATLPAAGDYTAEVYAQEGGAAAIDDPLLSSGPLAGIKALASLAALKRRLAITDTTDDTLLGEILEGVSRMIAELAGRTYAGVPCLLRETLTMTLSNPDYYRDALIMPGRPITSVASVTEAWDGDWEDATTLTEGTDYRIASDAGELIRLGGYWLVGTACIRITDLVVGYTPAGWTALSGERPVPGQLAEACLQQSSAVYQRRHDLGLTGVSGQGGSVSIAPETILPEVREICLRLESLL